MLDLGLAGDEGGLLHQGFLRLNHELSLTLVTINL
jgi:hypothetical protein